VTAGEWPVGLQLVGHRSRTERLLSLAHVVEPLVRVG